MTAVIEDRRPDAPDTVPTVEVKHEPRTYEYGNGRSFFQDLALRAAGRDPGVIGRLERHQRECDIETRVNPNTTAATGGEFAPPLWVIQQFQTAARAGRTLGDLVTTLRLPPGVSSIHVPKMTTGADANIQVSQGAAVPSVDEVTTDAGANGNIVTIAGEADASLQLLEQTPPPGYDGIVYRDLCLAYNQTLELQMLAGTGINGQLTGVTKVSGIGSVSGSGVSQTQDTMVSNLWTLIGQAAAIIGTQRQLPAEYVVMSPRRYYAIASAKDSSARPLGVIGSAPHPEDMPTAGGGRAVDRIIGIPCYLSGGIIQAASTAADYVLVARVADMVLYESDPRFVVDLDVLSGTLQARLQLRRYVAFLNFKPSSIAVVTAIPQPTNF